MQYSTTLCVTLLPSLLAGPSRTCLACGAAGPHDLGPGAGPYVASLVCRCGHRVRWLSRYQAKHYRLSHQTPARLWPDTTLGRAFRAAVQRAQEVQS